MILSENQLRDTLESLDIVIDNLIDASELRELCYANKAELLKRRTQLRTEVDLLCAEAIMSIKGEGKAAYAELPNGEIVHITNAEAREAFQKMASQKKRTELTLVEAEILQLELAYTREHERWLSAKAVADSTQTKAKLQAALLEFYGKGCSF